jgi:hypothetical protein
MTLSSPTERSIALVVLMSGIERPTSAIVKVLVEASSRPVSTQRILLSSGTTSSAAIIHEYVTASAATLSGQSSPAPTHDCTSASTGIHIASSSAHSASVPT